MNRISRVESVLSHQDECSSEYVSVYIYEPQSWHVQECLPRGDCILGSSAPLTAHTNSSKVSAEEVASSLPVWTSLRSDLASSPAFLVFRAAKTKTLASMCRSSSYARPANSVSYWWLNATDRPAPVSHPFKGAYCVELMMNAYWPSRTRSSKRSEISWPGPAGVPSSVLDTCLPKAHLVPDYTHESISNTSGLYPQGATRLVLKPGHNPGPRDR